MPTTIVCGAFSAAVCGCAEQAHSPAVKSIAKAISRPYTFALLIDFFPVW